MEPLSQSAEPLRGNVTQLASTSARELHLVRARAAELEIRVAELGARLVDSEQRAAELLRTRERLRQCEHEIQELRHQLSLLETAREQAEAAHERAARGLRGVTTSASWRLTAPLRSVKTRARARLGR